MESRNPLRFIYRQRCYLHVHPPLSSFYYSEVARASCLLLSSSSAGGTPALKTASGQRRLFFGYRYFFKMDWSFSNSIGFCTYSSILSAFVMCDLYFPAPVNAVMIIILLFAVFGS